MDALTLLLVVAIEVVLVVRWRMRQSVSEEHMSRPVARVGLRRIRVRS